MELADKGLNPQAQAIEEAQTEIRIIVRDGWLHMRPKTVINESVQKVIRAALQQLKTPDLRDAAYRSLNAFAERQYNTYLQHFGYDTTVFLAMMTLNGNPRSVVARERAERIVEEIQPRFETDAKGVPAKMYAKEYFDKLVKPVFEELVKQNPLDPGDITGHNTMRNRAEMEVRYNEHLQQIADLKSDGVKLVVSSVHADCSNRCYKWQGRVYSLDGTSGITEDGQRYEPLEKATDVYYTTKAGKVYKNGLLGFNCRHYLMPYKPGMVIPYVSKKTQQKERAINTQQRELEKTVRYWETKAAQNKDVNRKEYLAARKKAIAWRQEYRQFSHDNGRAYYPSRIKLFEEEKRQ